MRVFVTGASGWIGSAVVPELLDAGHQVTGLARSDASAAAVEAAGATAVRGGLDDLDLLRETAAASDAVVHLAFKHDIAFTGGFADAVGSDIAAVRALGEGLPEGAALTIAGGVLGLAVDGVPATEHDVPSADSLASARQGSTDAVMAFAPRRALVGRPTLPDRARRGRRGLRPHPDRRRAAPRGGRVPRRRGGPLDRRAPLRRRATLPARDRGRPGRVGPPRSGRRGGPGPRHRGGDRASPRRPRAAGDRRRGGRAVRVPGGVRELDSPATSAITRELTGWSPSGPGLLEDLDKGHYFAPGAGTKY